MDATSTRFPRHLAAALAVLLLAAACGGNGHGDAAGPPPFTPPGTRLVITTDNGLRLRPAADDRITVDGRVGHRWTHRDGTWVLDLSCAGHGDRAGRCPRMPEIGVPDGTGVTVSARNAGIDVAGVAGALDLTTVNGDVTLTRSGDRAAAVRLSTRNGSVRASVLRASGVHAETTNGDVVLGCATAPSGVTAATTNGSVRVAVPHDTPAYRLTATTANGRTAVTVPTDGARDDRTMELTTVNGDVDAHRD